MTGATKTLILLRHGQALSASAMESDANRKLSAQGQAEAENVGKIIADKNLKPDLVLCSTATRTRETLDGLHKSFAAPLAARYEQKIYSASENELLAQISAVADDVNSLLLIGHNPSLHQLAVHLARPGNTQLRDDLCLGFPPCAMAVFALEGGWNNIKNANSELQFFSTPTNS